MKNRFNKWANKYDNSILQKLLFKKTHDKIIENLNLRDNMGILDVACGTGKFLRRLEMMKEYTYLYGMDSSRKMISVAINKSSESIIYDIGNASNLPYYYNTIDIITCSHAFHHFVGFQCKFLEDARRILRKEGKIYIADGSVDNLWGKILFGKIINKIEKNVNHISKIAMRKLLEENGFKVIKQIQYNNLAPTLLTIGEKQ